MSTEISEKDLAQDEKLAEIEKQLALIEAKSGSVNLKTVASFGSIFGLLFAIVGGAITSNTESSIDAAISDATRSIETDADRNYATSSAVARLEGMVENVGNEATAKALNEVSHLESDLNRIERALESQSTNSDAEIAKIEQDVDELKARAASILDNDDITAQNEALNLRITNLSDIVNNKADTAQVDALSGQVTRIINGRIQPAINRNETHVERLEQGQLVELRRERDALQKAVIDLEARLPENQ